MAVDLVDLAMQELGMSRAKAVQFVALLDQSFVGQPREVMEAALRRALKIALDRRFGPSDPDRT
jgi:hypothetical protein